MEANELLLSTRTRVALDRLVQHPAHAILLQAPAGFGKQFVGRHLAAALLALPSRELEKYSYWHHIAAQNHTIKIEAIRTMRTQLIHKTLGDKLIRRVIMIEDAHLMTYAAQNALLKVLEEPPLDTSIILTAIPGTHLKDTILSRCQVVNMDNPTRQSATVFFRSKVADDSHLQRAYEISGGNMGLMTAIVTEKDHPLLAYIDKAKDLLRRNTFERLLLVDELAADKQGLPSLLEGLIRISQVALDKAALNGEDSVVRRWIRILKAAQTATESLSAHGQAKIHLTRLMLEI